MRLRVFAIAALFLGASTLLAGQSLPDQLFQRGDSLHRALRFQEAISAYMAVPGSAMDEKARAAQERRVAASQNGLNMMDFCAEPHVVARQRFSRKDFFLYYPLKPQSWHASPNPLDSLEGYPVYLPKDGRQVYYSAADRAGTRSLFMSVDLDSLWRAPRQLSESLTSTGSEIFPMLSPDGKTLYFASDGLFGMGGFDLYSSTWDDATGTWGEPVNLGFPFSSPADDFLLMDTEDGNYTLFASNRDCAPDSVYIYVLEFEGSRTRKAVRTEEELWRIVSLKPVHDPSRMDTSSALPEDIPGNANTRLYTRKMEEARALRDSIYRHEKALDELRTQLAKSGEVVAAAISARIKEREAALKPLKQLLEETNLEIRLVEQSFLQHGAVSSEGAGESEVVGADQSYTFARHAMGPRLRMKLGRLLSRPSFRVMPVGRFAADNTLPAGIVYQLELFTSPRHASLDDLNGLSPVYERLSANLRYTYSVGIYSTYQAALLDLNVVRCLGFPAARITAFRDGRSIPVSLARGEE